MAKDKNAPRYDKQGARRVMRKRDYLADLGGQLALGLMANLVGQLNYFYTDKVGLAVGSVGIVLAISKVIDAFTDVIAGNFIDHSKGGDHKYFRWILPQIIPAALIMVQMCIRDSYDDMRYSDQPFWIIWAVCELIKETGDLSILDTEIEWQDGGKASVLEHVKAAVNRLILDKGEHGLVKIYFADWNDALNITDDPEAESVMLSHQFCLALRELKRMMEYAGDTQYAGFLEKEYEQLKEDINRYAWDGKWYARALSSKGNVGTQDSAGSKIYLNAQTWAVLAGVADRERLAYVLEAVDSMEQDFGFPLNLPPYPEYDAHVGRMSGMLPGLFENGGVYCHATGFKILMDCCTGRGEKALKTLKKIMPDSEENPSAKSGAEPYVFTNCYSTNPEYYGKSYQSWTTGTSAWCMMGLYEGILGVKRDYEGLRISPCFPEEWEEAEVTRYFRGADYHIIIRNPEHIKNGKAEVYADGSICDSGLIPDYQDAKQHRIDVLIK